jgi:hypothetical protein
MPALPSLTYEDDLLYHHRNQLLQGGGGPGQHQQNQAQYIYIRTVSSWLLLCIDTLVSLLAGMGQYNFA